MLTRINKKCNNSGFISLRDLLDFLETFRSYFNTYSVLRTKINRIATDHIFPSDPKHCS